MMLQLLLASSDQTRQKQKLIRSAHPLQFPFSVWKAVVDRKHGPRNWFPGERDHGDVQTRGLTNCLGCHGNIALFSFASALSGFAARQLPQDDLFLAQSPTVLRSGCCKCLWDISAAPEGGDV